MSGNVAGRILPGGGATATAFTVSMLRRAGIDTGEATAAFGTSILLQISTTLALPILALPAILGGAPVKHDLATAAYLGITVLTALLAAAAVAFRYDEPLELAGRAAQWLLNQTVRRRHPIRGLPQEFIADRDFIRSTVGERWRAAALAVAGNTGFDPGPAMRSSLRRRRARRSSCSRTPPPSYWHCSRSRRAGSGSSRLGSSGR